MDSLLEGNAAVSIMRKIVLGYVIMIFIPVIAFGYHYYTQIYGNLTHQFVESRQKILEQAYADAREGGAFIEICRDPAVAVANAAAVYADSWYSMGQEHEATVAEHGPEGFLGQLFEVVAGDAAGDDDLVLVGGHHKAAQLG